MKLFVTINKDGIKINVGASAKNKLIKEYVTKDMPGIQVIVSVNVINLVILVNIWITQVVSVEKNELIH